MIYIPSSYVFLVGGEKTNSAGYYDLSKHLYFEHSTLKNQRCEPALAYIDNSFLYAFSGYNDSKTQISSIERINLRKNAKEWEEIIPKYDSGNNFGQIFFSVCALDTSRILLLGGHDWNGKAYAKINHVYDTKTNSITPYEPKITIEEDFDEKFFLPVKSSGVTNMYMFTKFYDPSEARVLKLTDGVLSSTLYTPS